MDDVSTNYNAIGTEIMEMIYATDYLSLGGADASARLAQLGGIQPQARILDVGSGLGGAAFFFAQQFAAQVIGFDLMQANVNAALARARQLGREEQVRFICGDAPPLPFADGSFDVVWGQDAWCHINNKPELIAEVARVLVPGGRIVFSDWLLGSAEGALNDEAKRIAASPTMGSISEYKDYLAAESFALDACEEASAEFAGQYQ